MSVGQGGECVVWIMELLPSMEIDSLMLANVDINKMGKDLKGKSSFPVSNTE